MGWKTSFISIKRQQNSQKGLKTEKNINLCIEIYLNPVIP
ncbi:hypothetical protein HMPREF0536_10110 [Limosilactobacillus reuteri MM4-1A]|uniref:Uncharacterized protein n=1 Tax=Limosilactobacillus reuteri MM4-1A TaxID=548485 RepID=A0A828RH98_LIMRT|nr:hypothetical protein HMPREF0535_1892 [Limosilactobacillus reuteri MM2-3]EGC15930.1 hypothetical protein HMPREF0536_10110 [Limosilactobacillus reuteri MM4-1A]